MDPVSLSDGGLILQCIINSGTDPNCACLLSGGGPQLNTDISGSGVRFSFYLQALFLGLMSALSNTVDEITGALYTLVATNIAMVVTSFILGFRGQPEMSLHDAIVVFYLLAISWTAIFSSLPTYVRFEDSDATLNIIYIIHSYMIFAFVLAVLITAHTFGTTPRCNPHAVVVIFKAFPALTAGRFLAFVVIAIVLVGYTLLTINDYGGFDRSRYGALGRWLMKWKVGRQEKVEEIRTEGASRAAEGNLRWMPGDSERGFNRPGPRSRADSVARQQEDRFQPITVPGVLLTEMAAIVVLWALSVMNTELLILRNRFNGGGDGIGPSLWGFGQILPMFLVILPFINLSKALIRLFFRKSKHVRAVHKTHISIREPMPRRTATGNNGHGHTRGPRPVPPRTAYNAHRSEWVPSFFQQAGTANAGAAGRQPSAHISEDSIHSNPIKLIPDVKDEEDVNGETNLRKESSPTRSSVFVLGSSSTSLRTDGYVTAEEDNI